MRFTRPMILGVALVSASSSLALSQQTPQAPVFPVRTGLVLVDFVVMDKSDRVVGGLKAQDFVVKEDGKERPIVSFAAFSKASATAPAPAEAKVDGVPTATPLTAEGVTTVLFVDDAQLKPQEVARLVPALKKLVDVIAEQKGVLALVAPGSNIQLADEASGNHAVFGAAIDKIVGHQLDDRSPYPVSDVEAILGEQEPAMGQGPGGAARNGDTMVERLAARFVYLNRGLLKYDMALITARGRITEVAAAARARREYAYEVLLKSLDFLAGRPGRRSVVMVSGGYASDKDDARQREIVNRSLQINAPIHFLDARGLQGMSRYLGVEYRSAIEHDAIEPPGSFSEAGAGASGLADDTGGLYVRNTNDMVKGLSRIVDMSGTYYILGYEPPEHSKRGFRKIKVEVATRGLKVHSRRGYFDEAVAPR